VITNGWISSARALTPCPVTSTPVNVVINAQRKLDAGADVARRRRRSAPRIHPGDPHLMSSPFVSSRILVWEWSRATKSASSPGTEIRE